LVPGLPSVTDSPAARVGVAQILQEGHSRIPIYQGNKGNILGGMLVKQLINIDPDDNVPVRLVRP
jgi:metal transporter CNNM